MRYTLKTPCVIKNQPAGHEQETLQACYFDFYKMEIYIYALDSHRVLGRIGMHQEDNQISIIKLSGKNLNFSLVMEAIVKILQIKQEQNKTIKINLSQIYQSSPLLPERWGRSRERFAVELYLQGFEIPMSMDKVSTWGPASSGMCHLLAKYKEIKNENEKIALKSALEKILQRRPAIAPMLIARIKKRLQDSNIICADVMTVDDLIENMIYDDFYTSGVNNETLRMLAAGERKGSRPPLSVVWMEMSGEKLARKRQEWKDVQPIEFKQNIQTNIDEDKFRSQARARFEQDTDEKSSDHPFHQLKKPTSLPEFSLSFVIQQLNSFLKYPPKERFRIIVDGKLHQKEKGWVKYSKREKGCLPAAFNALAVALSHLEKPEVSLDLVLSLFRAFSQNVEFPYTLSDSERTFRSVNSSVCFGLTSETTTREGILELLNIIEAQKEQYPAEEGYVLLPCNDSGLLAGNIPKFCYKDAIHAHSIVEIRKKWGVADNQQLAERIYANRDVWYFVAPCGDAYARQVESALNNYNQHIGEAKEQEAKLELIVTLAYDLEHLHIFPDANIRTVVIALMNRLLLQNGFCVATFLDPNIVDGHSKREFIEKVKDAMENTKRMSEEKNEEPINMFGFFTNTLSLDEQTEYAEMMRCFDNTLQIELERLKELQDALNAEFKGPGIN